MDDVERRRFLSSRFERGLEFDSTRLGRTFWKCLGGSKTGLGPANENVSRQWRTGLLLGVRVWRTLVASDIRHAAHRERMLPLSLPPVKDTHSVWIYYSVILYAKDMTTHSADETP